MIKPRTAGKPGVVLEIKTARKKQRTVDKSLKPALEQLQKNDYAAEMRASGVTPIHQIAVAFDGKIVKVALPKAAAKKGGKLQKVKDAVRKAAKKVVKWAADPSKWAPFSGAVQLRAVAECLAKLPIFDTLFAMVRRWLFGLSARASSKMALWLD